MRVILAPHLEERAIEQYIRCIAGRAQTPAIQATRTIQHRGRIYVVLRRTDGEVLTIYREERGGRLKLVKRSSRSLLEWVSEI